MNVEIPIELAEIALIALKFCDSEMHVAGPACEQLGNIIVNAKRLNKDANDQNDEQAGL